MLIALSGCAALPPLTVADINWQQRGQANWQLTDQKITASSGDGYLVSDRPYQDFILTLEFLAYPDVNSGVFVHCQDPDNITPLTCLEINIWDNHPNQAFRTGAVVTRAEPSVVIDTLGQWSRYRIIASGDALTVYLNGERVAALEGLQLTSGMLALQRLGEGSISFRDVQLVLTKD